MSAEEAFADAEVHQISGLGNSSGWGFRYSVSGVEWRDDGGDSPEWRRLCDPLEVAADTRDAGSENWGRLLVFEDRDGVRHEWAAAAANKVLDAVQGTPAVHLCFGNYAGQSIQQGSWDRLMQYLNSLHADHIVMEMAHREPAELAVFKELDPKIGLGIGVVDVKRTEVETADNIARAIENAEKLLGPGRITYIHPDCGFWMLKRPIADAKIRALVLGRDLYEGRP